MSDKPFVHLHCHSHYSLLDGASTLPALVGQAKSQGMNALALTDHGNLYGAVEFYMECKKAGINPVVGYEAYVAPGHRTDKQTRGDLGNEASFHLTMLAQNRQGFKNLVKLASHAYLEGFYYKPRIDKELLEAHSEGITVLSGSASGEFSSFILRDRLDEACELAGWFARIFKDRFYVEIQDNGLDLQKRCAEGAIAVANRVGLPLVATCDTHYLCSDDAEAHEVLLCINTGKVMSDPKRMQYGSKEFYLRSPEEMYRCFPSHADAVKRSQEIADSVAIDLDFKARHFPIFEPPPGKTDKEHLRDICREGFERRYPDDGTQAARDHRAAAEERLALELGVIEKLGFASYFLIVWDFCNFALTNGIACGARGSACGALVSYLLGFSNVDPLIYDLLFERFLDPNRAEAPDIDIDFDQNRRDEVIEYVRRKYGEKNVAQIVTFNTLAARAVLKDVGRALEFPLSRVDALTKQVPSRPKVTLADALKEVPELQRECDRDPDVKRLFDIARRLEGLARNPGVHAAGVVVADTDLSEYVPLQKNGDVVTTQWEMSILEKVGMLKVDFLGLRNLTLLTAAVKLIQAKRDSNFDLAKLPLDDVKTYQLMQRGETKGVFQLESEGIRNLLIKMKPDRFADVIATNALYRPGPLGGGMVDKYIAVKHGRERAEYSHKVMKDVLEETYGVMVYQEQVMRILNRLGGIDLASSYKCIKAISKKDTAIIVKNKEQFVEGARQQGLAADKANEIFELIEYFAGYGFNKSHSTAYALVAYQTAFLKAHYPAEFMAALMSSEVDKTDLLAEHIEDCRRIGLQVKPPDVNHGESAFTVEGKVIRFGLLAIKGVGEKAVESIVAEREKTGPYRSIFDFCERIDHKLVGKGCVESLVKGGAFDGLGNRRRQLFDVLPTALQAGASARAAREAGQGMLFGGDADDVPQTIAMALPDLPEWADQEKLGYERALLGVYLSSHPLAEHERMLRLFRSHPVNELRALQHGREVVLGGMISAKRVLTTKKGRNANQRYARFAFEDLSGSASCVMFSDQFAEYGDSIVDDAVVFVRAEIDASVRPGSAAPRDGEELPATSQEISLIVNEVIAFADAPRKLSGSFVVRLDAARAEADHVDRLAKLLATRPGNSPVYIEILAADGLRARMRAGAQIQVTCDQELARMVEDLLGEGAAQIRPPVQEAPRRSANGGGYRRGAPAYGNGSSR